MELFDIVNLLAKKTNRSPTALALAWVLQQKFPSYAIIGPKNEMQLKNSLESLEFNLSESDIRLLNQEKH